MFYKEDLKLVKMDKLNSTNFFNETLKKTQYSFSSTINSTKDEELKK